jgi:hypothetical protein
MGQEVGDRRLMKVGVWGILRLGYMKYSNEECFNVIFQTYGGVNFHEVIVHYFDIDDLFLLYWII